MGSRSDLTNGPNCPRRSSSLERIDKELPHTVLRGAFRQSGSKECIRHQGGQPSEKGLVLPIGWLWDQEGQGVVDRYVVISTEVDSVSGPDKDGGWRAHAVDGGVRQGHAVSQAGCSVRLPARKSPDDLRAELVAVRCDAFGCDLE